MAGFTLLGDGTLTIGTVPNAFSCEVLGWHVTHAYNEVGSARTMQCGTNRPASTVRANGMGGAIENDLSATGLYQYLLDNDLTDQPVTWTPNTADGAVWVLTCQMRLPDTIGADEYGQPLISAVEWQGVGDIDYTPAVYDAA